MAVSIETLKKTNIRQKEEIKALKEENEALEEEIEQLKVLCGLSKYELIEKIYMLAERNDEISNMKKIAVQDAERYRHLAQTYLEKYRRCSREINRIRSQLEEKDRTILKLRVYGRS